MARSLDRPGPGSGSCAGAKSGRQLVVGTLAGRHAAALTLTDLQLAGFIGEEVAFVARAGDASPPASASAEPPPGLGATNVVSCRGLGTLLIGGGALGSLRALGERISLAELGGALVAAGLPAADALIHELGLIRGQCIFAVRATSEERVQVAYRLLLRCGSREVHTYRP